MSLYDYLAIAFAFAVYGLAAVGIILLVGLLLAIVPWIAWILIAGKVSLVYFWGGGCVSCLGALAVHFS